jgi:hypothetical protein
LSQQLHSATATFLVGPCHASGWPSTAEAGFQSQANTCGIHGGKSGSGTGVSPSTLVFDGQYHSGAL